MQFYLGEQNYKVDVNKKKLLRIGNHVRMPQRTTFRDAL